MESIVEFHRKDNILDTLDRLKEPLAEHNLQLVHSEEHCIEGEVEAYKLCKIVDDSWCEDNQPY